MARKVKSEKTYIIEAYRKYFSAMYPDKIVIYGIGANTQIILENFVTDNIVGLMDEMRSGDIIYGKRILTMNEVVSLGVSAIIIVARASNVNIIYRRIKDACAENAINVFDICGNVLSPENTAIGSSENSPRITVEEAKRRIAGADIVSFDIFDTLLMRRVLYPRDIFLLAEKEHGVDFAKRRIKAETDLYREGRQPTIYDIYAHLGEKAPDIELSLEAQYLIRRESMCGLLQYALDIGKAVYLVSDMYLTGDILKGILDSLGICIDRSHILVSCDYGVSKEDGLFYVLKEKAGPGIYLHIGDDWESDIRAAQRDGINNVLQIESSLKMLDASPAKGLLSFDNTLENRRVIGEFIARMLNDPFLFAEQCGRFRAVGKEIASFVAPLLLKFAYWLREEAKNFDLLLLGARDGFLMDLIFRKVPGCDCPSVYFYISRAAAALAGIRTEADIFELCNYAFSGTAEQMLQVRFGVQPIMKLGKDESDIDYMMKHKAEIFQVASKQRNNLKTYISRFDISKNAKIGLVDFVSTGSTQRWLSRLVDFNLTGLYFGYLGKQNGSNVAAKSLFWLENMFEGKEYFMKNYFLLENVLTSFEPTVKCFNENGNPVFFSETRTPDELRELSDIQTAVLDYGSSMADIDYSKVSLKLADSIFGLSAPDCCTMESYVAFNHEDSFCGR